jgi:hypothetical protein
MKGWQLVYEADSYSLLTMCIAELILTCSWLFTMKFINENMYSYRTVKISHILNRLLHEFLGLTPAIDLIIFFCKVNTVSFVRFESFAC